MPTGLAGLAGWVYWLVLLRLPTDGKQRCWSLPVPSSHPYLTQVPKNSEQLMRKAYLEAPIEGHLFKRLWKVA